MSERANSDGTSRIVQAILENTMAVIYAKDLDGRYQLINRRFEQLFDVTAKEVKERTDYDLFPAELADKFRRNDDMVARRNEAIECEEVAPHEDGPHTYISLKFPYRDEQGNCIGTCGVSTDITPRKKIEAALKQGEERFRQLANNVHACFWVTEVDTWRVLYVNPAFEQIWQRSCEELYEKPSTWTDAIHPADRKRIKTAFLKKVTEGNFQEEYRIVLPDGSIRWIADRGFPIRNLNGEVYRVAGIAEDITNRRALEQQVVEISSQERQRISRDLHDSLGQQLTGIGFLMKRLTNRLADSSAANQQAAREVLDGIQEALSEVRRVVRGLAPVDLDEYGLASALQQLASSIRKYSGISCEFACPESVAVENNAVATQLFRIAQEATNNALKHSDATEIVIALQLSTGQLTLTIRDNGHGSDEIQAAEGMGVRIMNYRSRVIGAELALESEPHGTTVTCTLPWEDRCG